jgi:RNA polymerase sigma-70 factor, ECF subfamily
MDAQVLKYQKELLAYSYFLTKNRSDADDLLHDTMLRVFSKREFFNQINNVKSYLMTVMHNIYIDSVRKQKLRLRYNNYQLETQFEPFANNSESKMVMDDIYKYIQSIKQDWREPFLMHYQGFSYDEMSEKTGLNVETLRMRVFYARQDLGKKLKIVNFA